MLSLCASPDRWTLPRPIFGIVRIVTVRSTTAWQLLLVCDKQRCYSSGCLSVRFCYATAALNAEGVKGGFSTMIRKKGTTHIQFCSKITFNTHGLRSTPVKVATAYLQDFYQTKHIHWKERGRKQKLLSIMYTDFKCIHEIMWKKKKRTGCARLMTMKCSCEETWRQ